MNTGSAEARGASAQGHVHPTPNRPATVSVHR